MSIKKLSALQDVLKCLDSVVRLETDALSTAQQTELATLQVRVKRQLEKLQRNEFHIAVVGLEKAGKSTFLNAWLRHDLLPNRQERCTYATTELRSSSERERHQLIIEYLDRTRFEEDLKSYEERAKTGGQEGRAAAADVEEIRRYRPILEGLLGRSPDTRSYASLEEIRPDLQHYVANPEVARALRSVTLRSAQLYHHSGIVFHDVPGYDSPISMHRELARQELARADAILFVINVVASTSLNRDQLDMINVADEEDPELLTRDKLFVFLNKIDGASSKADLQQRTDQARQTLLNSSLQCIPERIVPGSAGAYLLTECSVMPETRDMLESAPRRLEELSPPFGNGIEHLRKLVEQYLEHERSALLERRCDALVNKGRNLAQHALEAIGARYPTSAAELEIREKVDRDDAVQRWLDQQWKRFQDSFAAHWNTAIMPSQSPDARQTLNPAFQRVKEAYEAALAPLENELQEQMLRKTLQQIHDRIRGIYSQPIQAGQELRRQLGEMHIAPGLEEVTAQMSGTILEQFTLIADWVQESFFGLDGVRSQALPESPTAYQVRLDHGLSTLFLRHARPCLPLMVENPRGEKFRRSMMEVYRAEALSLQSFYSNPQHPERANLVQFLLGGSAVPPALIQGAAKVGGEVAKGSGVPEVLVEPITDSLTEHLLREIATTPEIADTIASVTSEIVEDCQVLIDYLKHAVYRATGFEAYCEAELGRVRNHLLGKHSERARQKIQYELRLAIERRDPRLPAEIHALSDTSHRRHVVEALGLLRASLNSTSFSSLIRSLS